MMAIEDRQSIGAMRAVSALLGRRVGGSTGTNIWSCLMLIREMAAAGKTGSIVTLLCDSGDRYSGTYYNDDWLKSHQIDWQADCREVFDALASDAEQANFPGVDVC
jgi:cysteine synthase A